MNDIWWQTIDEGGCHLMLSHGWGLSAQVWDHITPQLASYFTLHLVDLPGYSHSGGYGTMSLEVMAQRVPELAPPRTVWLGWSLGGLMASQVAMMHPERMQALITIASSPYFAARDGWPGIKPEVLAGFQQQLSDDFRHTVERFLALQATGTENTRQNARALKQTVLSLSIPSTEALNGGLGILRTIGLHQTSVGLPIPFLRLYGQLDRLVPRKIVPLLDELWPGGKSVLFDKAVHAPFASHPTTFCEPLLALKTRLRQSFLPHHDKWAVLDNTQVVMAVDYFIPPP